MLFLDNNIFNGFVNKIFLIDIYYKIDNSIIETPVTHTAPVTSRKDRRHIWWSPIMTNKHMSN